MASTILVIPDCQVKPSSDTRYLEWIGKYAVNKKPDTIVCIGDFADMESLSSYDKGRKSFEGRRYKYDILAAREAMQRLLSPIKEYNELQKKSKHKPYNPRKVLTLGNHEERILRATESSPELDGVLSISDLNYEKCGFEVYPYLEPVEIDGIAFCHYFTSGVMGRAVPSARMLVIKKHVSCVMGHNQNWEIHRDVTATGKPIIGLFVGCCNLQDEVYLGPQGNHYGRGIWMLYECGNGTFIPHYISLNFLEKKYGSE